MSTEDRGYLRCPWIERLILGAVVAGDGELESWDGFLA